MFKILRRASSSIQPSNINHILTTKNHVEHVQIKGWIKSVRKMKNCTFLDVSDGSTPLKLQVVVDKNLCVHLPTTGSSITVSGKLDKTPTGQLELKANVIEIPGKCKLEEGYPFAPRKSYSPEYVREYLHLRGRTNKFASLLRIRDFASTAFHQYLRSKGYLHIHAPILTSNDCEGAGEVFRVQPESEKLVQEMSREGVSSNETFFNRKVYLTVSSQMHLEAMAHGLSRVYTLGPTFRAENSRSRLHLSEFYMLEAEVAFVQQLEDLIAIIQTMLQTVTQRLQNDYEIDLNQAREDDSKIDLNWSTKDEFPILTYDHALELLKANGRLTQKASGLTKEDELFIVKYCGNIPTFIINFPKAQKPFYMKECVESSERVAALDLLVPFVGELVGGSLREDDYEKLKGKLPTSALQWYLDLRKFGSVPTAGFGLGFERYLQSLLGIASIKDTIPFPRWPHNCAH